LTVRGQIGTLRRFSALNRWTARHSIVPLEAARPASIADDLALPITLLSSRAFFLPDARSDLIPIGD
jgi:hypothetical protein